LRSKAACGGLVSRPAHFKELRTGDARPLRLRARESAGTASPLAVPLAFARGHRVRQSLQKRDQYPKPTADLKWTRILEL